MSRYKTPQTLSLRRLSNDMYSHCRSVRHFEL